MPWCHECVKEYDEGATSCAVCGRALFEDMPPELMEPAALERGGAGALRWPTDEKGIPIKPAFLAKVVGNQLDYEMQVGLLRAFGVPVQTDLPNSGQLVRILFGFTGAGSDIYVPETMLEEARALLEPVDTRDDGE